MADQQFPKVLVLILSYNGLELLRDSVPSYLGAIYENFQVAVIDNGSTDNTDEYLQENHPNIIRIRTEVNLGYSGGMNLGLTYAFNQNDYDYVLITNNDVIADPNIIKACVECAVKNDQIAFVTGKVYYYEKPDTFQTVGKKSDDLMIRGGHIGRHERDTGQYDQDRELDFCDDIFWMVSRRVYQQTGGYDTEFFLQAEDFDWQLRAKKAGFKIMYSHRARLWHKESMTIGRSTPIKAYYDARNPMIAIMKNCEHKVVVSYLKRRIWYVLIPALLINAMKGRFQIALATLRGLLSALYWKYRNH